MNINMKVIAILVGTTSLIALYTYNKDKEVYEGNDEKQTIFEIENNDAFENTNPKDIKLEEIKTVPETVNDALTNQLDNKIPYEGEWCSRMTDLNRNDLNYSIAQSQEWEVARGKLNFGSEQKPLSAKIVSPSDVLVAQYKEMTSDSLLGLMDTGDEIAMIALLSRPDIESQQRSKIARELLVLGKTGNALEYLVINEIAPVKVAISEHGKLNDKNKTNLVNAIAYANYGLERLDAGGLYTLLLMLENIKGKIEPLKMLSQDDIRKASDKLIEIKRDIEKERFARNFEPISNKDIPKIANHDFEFSLALSYAAFEDRMILFSVLNSSHTDILLTNDCVKQQFALLR